MTRALAGSRLAVIGLTVAVALAGLELLGQRIAAPWPRYPWVNHDALSLLLTGRQVFEGKGQLYRDSWDSNFPAIHALSLLANRLGGGDSFATVNVFHAGVLLLGWFGGLILIGGWRGPRPPGWPAPLAVYLFVLFCPTIPSWPEFGQREHLFALVLIPWLAWRLGAIELPATRLRLPLAFLLGWLGSIKPTFLAIPLAVELVILCPVRLTRYDQLAVLSGLVVPLIPIALLDPEAFRIFLFEVLPVHVTPWYRLGFGIPWHEVARTPPALVAFAEAAVLAALLVRGVRRQAIPGVEARGWAVAIAVAAVGVAVQGTGFAYHFIPLQAVLGFALVRAAIRTVGSRVAVTGALVALGLGASSFVTTVRWRRVEPSGIVRIVPPGATVMVFSTDVHFAYDAWFQRWNFHGTWGARVLLEGQTLDPDRARGQAGLIRDRDRSRETLQSRPEFLLVRHTPFRGYANLEDALVRAVGILPAPGYRRLADADVARRAGPGTHWVVYVRQRVR